MLNKSLAMIDIG